ncbi:MAG TPA: hypothetical protein VGB03_04570 [Acidimicrobiales bacterium]|jgi:NADH pyrophosphatase NudC (nudix superfamily)
MGDWPTWLRVVFVAAVLGEAGVVAYFRWSRDWATKERWFLRHAIASGVAFGGTVLVLRRPSLAVGAVVTAAMSTSAVRNTRFCHRCGRTNVLRGNPRPRNCRRCGFDLTTQAAGAA